MAVEWTFIVWLIIVVLVFFLTRNYNITWWSSLVLALLAGLFVLLIGVGLCFRDSVGGDCDDESSDFSSRHSRKRCDNGFALPLLGFILLISVVVIVIYLIQRVFDDQCPC
uniref:Transmembrane protein n=1 Tax=Pithovirus LCPAC101 TaxID=2506586 RepID=A0A481Z2K3_9VIRU|nr:MAG: uncharacterized protein LCPAC101_02060 [Pithovirus LCPAC101]